MYSKFREYIHKHKLIVKDQLVLLAISGGVDSMVMLGLFQKSRYKIAIAHCNFQLRAKESDEDEEFVKLYATNHQIPFYSIQFQTKQYADEKGISIQMAARELRYDWFKAILLKNKYDLIATAHHADDMIETFLTNLTRGTGIKGLTGIKEKTGNIIRPLMFSTRNEIEKYAKQNNIVFREDSSNKSVKYYRNYIRHNLIPKFEKLNPDFRTTINETINRLRETETIYRYEIDKRKKEIIQYKNNKIYLAIGKLKELHPLKSYLFEFLRPYKFSEDNLEKIIKSLDSQPGKKFYSETFCLIKDRENLVIYPKASENQINMNYLIDKKIRKLTKPLNLSFNTISLDSNFRIEKNENIAQLNFEKLRFPLNLRKWKEGDCFYPLGMSKKKKLSDFFIDNKLSTLQKENTWVITSGDKIAWIVGLRIDERYKITDSTSSIYTINLSSI